MLPGLVNQHLPGGDAIDGTDLFFLLQAKT